MNASSKKIPRPNLISQTIPAEKGGEVALLDLSMVDYESGAPISVYFRDLEQRLVGRIQEAACVFGCVAWLTNKAILEAMAEKSISQIVIQKEDFLRPDTGSSRNFKPDLRDLYSNVAGVYRAHLNGDIAISKTWTTMSEAERIDGVRCLGYRKQHHAELMPVMHHKFLVFCRYTESPYEDYPFGHIDPYAVWTGSFNFTRNATRSFENAVFIQDAVIARAFFREWGQLAALSEPLDWESDYVAPQYWIGTGT